METYPQPRQPASPLGLLPRQAYYQLIHTLGATLPPPVNDTPEALLARTHAAIDEVAAMLPTNANEAGFAAQCVAARAQANDALRLIRKHDGDIDVVMKLNAQYVAMVRASLAASGHLRRTQAVRYKREASDAALKADESTQYIATRLMEQALDAGPVPAVPAAEPSAPAPAAQPPAPAPEPAPAADPPVPTLAAAPPPAEAPALPPVSAPVAASLPAPAAPVPAATPQRSRRLATPAEADEPPRDLAAAAEYYAAVYPHRTREIRRYGGLPPDCSFGPPDDELVRELVTSTSPTLRALDGVLAAAD